MTHDQYHDLSVFPEPVTPPGEPSDDFPYASASSTHLFEGCAVDYLSAGRVWIHATVSKYTPLELRIALSYVDFDDSISTVWLDVNSERIQPLGTRTYVRGKNTPEVAQLVSVRIRGDDRYHLAKVLEKSGNNYYLSLYIPEYKDFVGEHIAPIEDIYNYPCIPLSSSKLTGTNNSLQQDLSVDTVDSGPQSPTSSSSTAVCRTTPQYAAFTKSLEDLGFTVVPIIGDGNCLFRSISDQVYGDQNHHVIIREAAVELMKLRRSNFSAFISEADGGFDAYVDRMKRQGVWGGDQEIQALTELYQRPIEVWTYCEREGAKLGREVPFIGGTEPICLAFITEGHYDSLHSSTWSQNLLRSTPGKFEKRALQKLKLIEEQAQQQNVHVSVAKGKDTSTAVSSGQIRPSGLGLQDGTRGAIHATRGVQPTDLSIKVPVACYSDAEAPKAISKPVVSSGSVHKDQSETKETSPRASCLELINTRKRGHCISSPVNKQLRTDILCKDSSAPPTTASHISRPHRPSSDDSSRRAPSDMRATTDDVSGDYKPSVLTDPPYPGAMDEEEQLRLAIAMSLESHSTNAAQGFHTPTNLVSKDETASISPTSSASANPGDNLATAPGECEDVRKAIEQSMLDEVERSILEDSKRVAQEKEEEEMYEAMQRSYLEFLKASNPDGPSASVKNRSST